LLIQIYEEVRRTQQFGYRAFKRLDAEAKSTPLFTQFHTVTAWLIQQEFVVSWSDVRWRGFVEYVFQELKPRIPQPGQLKNQRLLRQYRRTLAEGEDAPKRNDYIYELYDKVISPEVLSDVRLLATLGLERIVTCKSSKTKSSQ
jgi:hypothetical protein